MYPEVVFWQADGARDNTSLTVFALCQYLIETGIVKRQIVFTRLPAGHGHEDIDAQFGIIWEAIRNIAVMTPQDYSTQLNAIFRGCVEKELFILPDYGSYFKASIDPDIKNYSVMSDTQLQWVFEKCKPGSAIQSECFYRAYADTERPLMFSRELEAGLLAKDINAIEEYKKTAVIVNDLKSNVIGARVKRSGALWKMANSIKDNLRTSDLQEEPSEWARTFEIHEASKLSVETDLGN